MCVFSFPFFASNRNCFPLEKGIFVYFWVSPFVLLSLFWPPPFSISLSPSLSLSLSLLFFFNFFFLLVFLVCFLLIPCFCLFRCFSFFFAFVWWKNNIKTFHCNLFKSIFPLWGGAPVFFYLSNPFSYLCFFLIFSYVFCSTSMLLVSKTQVEKHQFLVKRGVATKRVFMNLCLAKCDKLSFGGGHYFGKFWLFFKKHYNNMYFSTFLKAKKDHFSMLLTGPSQSFLTGPSWGSNKKANLAQLITLKFARAIFFLLKNVLKPLFYSAFGQTVFFKNKPGPVNNFENGQTWPSK